MSHKPIVIHLPNPCGQNWDEMTPMGMGKLCAQCQTQVIDFTTWSDESLFAYFKQNTGDVCGLFHFGQVDRPIIASKRPSKFYRIAVALGLTLIGAQQSQLQARPRPPLVENQSNLESIYSEDDSFGPGITFLGTVFDANNQPVANAYVEVTKDKGIAVGAATDSNGVFEMTLLSAGPHTVNIYVGNKIELTRKLAVVEGKVNSGHYILKNISRYTDKSDGLIMGKKMPAPKK